MPKKRKSAEPNNDEQANESSGSLSQNEDNAKRAKLDLLSDTTLQDLPVELLELILIKAVVMEVKGLKLAKCAWKEKADPVISRLRPVCSHWSNILTTDHFRTVLHRTLNQTAQETIRLEVLLESSSIRPVVTVGQGLHGLATLNDEIFMARRARDEHYVINVYDRDKIKVLKEVISLPRSNLVYMAACNVSNCVYVGLRYDGCLCLSVLRIWKDAEDKFNQSPWKNDNGRLIDMFSVSANGSLLIFSRGDVWNPTIITVHNANGSLQLEMLLPRSIGALRHMLQKSNGNLVVSYDNYYDFQNVASAKLAEIDTTGNVVRQYESTFDRMSCVNFADSSGRIMITCDVYEPFVSIELLDSELNLLGMYSLQQDFGKNLYLYDIHFDNNERNEIMRYHYDRSIWKDVLTIFRFTDE